MFLIEHKAEGEWREQFRGTVSVNGSISYKFENVKAKENNWRSAWESLFHSYIPEIIKVWEILHRCSVRRCPFVFQFLSCHFLASSQLPGVVCGVQCSPRPQLFGRVLSPGPFPFWLLHHLNSALCSALPQVAFTVQNASLLELGEKNIGCIIIAWFFDLLEQNFCEDRTGF